MNEMLPLINSSFLQNRMLTVILPPISLFTIAIAAPNLSGVQKQTTNGKLATLRRNLSNTSKAQPTRKVSHAVRIEDMRCHPVQFETTQK